MTALQRKLYTFKVTVCSFGCFVSLEHPTDE